MQKVIVIGGGIAGCSTAYFLKKAGFDVTLYEMDTICSGGSYAAGAFLSPKLSKPSTYKDYLNTSLEFSLDFYEKNFPQTLKRVKLHKYPKDDKDWQKLLSYEEFIDFEYEKKDGYFELDFAGMVEPKELCLALLENIEYHEHYKINLLEEFKNSIIVLATPNQNFFDEPYLKTKNIYGYRYDVLFDGFHDKDFNSFKDVSVSCYFKEKVVVGATYIRDKNTLENSAKTDGENLIKKANDFFPMQNLKVLKKYTGSRNMTFDFFPIVGKLINSKETINHYPYIKKGSKVPPSRYIYHDNTYIHTALGSRGFVYAPYNAKLLVDMIVKDTQIDDRLSPVRLFKRYVRKV